MKSFPPRALAWAAVAGSSLTAASGAHAQPVATPSYTVEAASDARHDGLSWSAGKPTISVAATLPATDALAFDLGAVALRDSARHGGADVGLTLAPRVTVANGAWAVDLGVRGNVFVGRSGMSYLELTGRAEHTIGPARLIAGIDYAPSQDTIGGSNLHVEARTRIGVPGLPLSVYGGVGHTSGSSRNDPRAQRLRPGGAFFDHHLGIEHSRRNLSVGLRYSDTSISEREVDRTSRYYDRHYGARVLAYVRLDS